MSIRVGDRVTATNGESTLVGTVTDTSSPWCTRVKVDNDHGFVTGGRTLYHSVWTIQKHLPPEPPVAGVVVLSRSSESSHQDGFYVRQQEGEYPWHWIGPNGQLWPGTNWRHLNDIGVVTEVYCV